jgi:allantoinase
MRPGVPPFVHRRLNPAERYGLGGRKGRLAVGYDADFCLVDQDTSWTIHAEDSESSQEYTPFEGFDLNAKVTDTWVRGLRVLQDGRVVGEPRGEYVPRGLPTKGDA